MAVCALIVSNLSLMHHCYDLIMYNYNKLNDYTKELRDYLIPSKCKISLCNELLL